MHAQGNFYTKFKDTSNFDTLPMSNRCTTDTTISNTSKGTYIPIFGVVVVGCQVCETPLYRKDQFRYRRERCPLRRTFTRRGTADRLRDQLPASLMHRFDSLLAREFASLLWHCRATMTMSPEIQRSIQLLHAYL